MIPTSQPAGSGRGINQGETCLAGLGIKGELAFVGLVWSG